MITIIDDQLLGAALRTGVASNDGELFTTGQWYVRLCQAVLGASGRPGVLSSPFAALPATARDQAIEALLELPDGIGLVSLRDLAAVIGRLRQRHQLNILAMEALAAAVRLEASIQISAAAPKLQRALEIEGRPCEIIA